MTAVELVLDARAALGECPVWCAEAQRLWWVDIHAPAVNALDPATGANQRFTMPEPVGSLALCREGGLIVALASGFARFDPASGELEPIVDPEPDQPDSRLNDGRCDPDGRFWCGSMLNPPDSTRAVGRLHRLDPDGGSSTHADGLFVPNGLAFSPDGRVMYLSDSHPSIRTIWAFDYDRDDGVPFNRRVFAETRGMPGRPDGAAVDAEGCYWSAANDGWELVRYSPDGRVDRRVALPISKPSMPAFGGDDLRTLFVTSIRAPDLDLEAEPLAGGIFALHPGVTGLAEPRFAG